MDSFILRFLWPSSVVQNYKHFLFFFLFAFTLPLFAQPKKEASPPIAFLELRDLPLREAVRIFSEQTGLNVVPSSEASSVKVSLLLRNISSEDALDILCKTHQLWYKKEAKNGIYRIHTLKEYLQDLASFQEEQTEVFTFLYPNASDIARAIRDLYGERVLFTQGNEDSEITEELESRYERFDLLEERSEGIGTLGGSNNNLNQNNNQQNNQNNTTRNNRQTNNQQRSQTQNQNQRQEQVFRRDRFENLTTEEIQAIENALAGKEINSQVLESLLKRRSTTIYLTVLRRQNRIAIRTGDEKALSQIRDLVQKLDIPTPMVLLEVKVLQVTLGDGFNSVFDLSFKDRTYSGNFTEGEIVHPPEGSFLPGGAGFQSDALLFQYVSGSFANRIQFFESQNRVTTLATPLLLTANREVSRLFAGDTLPIVTGFSDPQTITNDNNTVVIPGSPITERQDVGTALLITPSINADRTVTLQILQETSEVNRGGARIPVAAADGTLVEQNIDTVKRRTLAGTIIAKDGLAIAVGGLIEESVGSQIEKVPLLGEIPLLGMLFRREKTSKSRQELVIVIRPYILSTVVDTEKVSQDLLEELSLHPNVPTLRGTLNTYQPEEVRKGDAPLSDLHKLFKFHSTKED